MVHAVGRGGADEKDVTLLMNGEHRKIVLVVFIFS
jgi:hypothetical protein